MKKIYSFIALMLMCFVGTANAQDTWQKTSEENVTQILDGKEHFYVIAGADNTKIVDGVPTPGKDAGNLNLYITGKGKTEVMQDEAVWHFIKLSEKKNGLDVYILENVATGKYLINSADRFTTSKTKAFKFTAVPAELKAEKDALPDGIANKATWEVYHNAASDARAVLAAGKWIFCSIEDQTYLLYVGGPDFGKWIDVNNWNVFEVERAQLSPYKKLSGLYAANFPNSVTEDNFIVGKHPGCISEAFYKKLKALSEAIESTMPTAPDAECEDLYNQLVQILEEMKTEIIPVGPGYFVLRNVDKQKRGFVTTTADGTGAHGDNSLATDDNPYETWNPDLIAWNLDNAKFIWKFEESKEDGRLLMKNFGTGQYLSAKEDFAMLDEPNGGFLVQNYQNLEFYLTLLKGQIMHMNNHSGNMLTTYLLSDAASRFQFYAVDQHAVDSLSGIVAQMAKNEKLAKLVETARNDKAGLEYNNGFVNGGFYNFPSDSGLVREVLETYGADKGKTGAEMFDGKLNTFYHTAWSSENIPNVIEGSSHWVKMDLGKEVSSLVIKFTKRQASVNNHINKYAIYTTAPGEDVATAGEKWSEKLFETVDSITYTYGNKDTYIDTIELSQKARYILFEVKSTRGRDASEYDRMTSGTGPFWHCSEFRLYDLADCTPNPKYTLMPAEVKDALDAAIEQASKEIADSVATQETYKELETALKNFWEAYPDDSSLKNQLENAKNLVDFAVEHDGVGFYKPGSKQKYLDAVNAIIKEVEDAENAGLALSLEKIKELEGKLDAAKVAFNASLQKPVAGKIYRIVFNGDQFEGNGSTTKVQYSSVVAAPNADYLNGSPVFAYSTNDGDIDSRWNALWYVDELGGRYSFRNVANGLYINNVFDGLTEEEIDSLELEDSRLGWSIEPKYFSFESYAPTKAAAEKGSFLLTLTKGHYVNFQGYGKMMVHYEDPNDPNAPLTLEEPASITDSYSVDIVPGQAQVVTLPFELEYVYTTNDNAYRVEGKQGNKLYLSPYLDGEVIEAGTPFIIFPNPADGTTEAESLLSVETSAYDGSSLDAMIYKYEVVTENGLVSAPFSFTVKPGTAYGILYEGNVVATEGGEEIAAGTGFFNSTIPAVEGASGKALLIDGDITSEGTGVGNIEFVKNVSSDVYSISGVKVRQNVKASGATKNLPKGVYIVGGKKVIVK